MLVQSESQTLDGNGNIITSTPQGAGRGIDVQIRTSAGAVTDFPIKAANTPAVAADTAVIVTQSPNREQTYSAAATAVIPAANTTDMFTITGSASKTVKIKRIVVTGTSNSDIDIELRLIKRSTANTGGASAVLTAVPHDSLNAAATAIVRSYTANPVLGTQVGVMVSLKSQIGDNNGPSASIGLPLIESTAQKQDITLHGVNEVLAVNLNGAAKQTNQIMSFCIEWSEV